MDSVRAAIIGCGVVAPDHATGYRAVDGVSLTVACDVVHDKAARLAERFGIARACTDYREVLADPSVTCVSICTDHGSHSTIAVDALRAGKHVLCEKALAASSSGLDAMVHEAARHPELVFAGVFQHRFDGVHRALKSLIDRGALGRLLLGSTHLSCLRSDAYYQGDAWRGTWAEEGGAVLINQAIHFIDQLAWLMGGVTSVSGAWANRTHQESMETEDSAVAALVFGSGAVGTISATCSSHLGWEPVLCLRGDEGSIDLRNGAPTLVAFADKERERSVVAELASSRDPSHRALKDHYGPNHPSQIADFVRAVRTGARPFVTGQDARHAVDVVLAVYESHRTGRRVDIRSKPVND